MSAILRVHESLKLPLVNKVIDLVYKLILQTSVVNSSVAFLNCSTLEMVTDIDRMDLLLSCFQENHALEKCRYSTSAFGELHCYHPWKKHVWARVPESRCQEYKSRILHQEWYFIESKWVQTPSKMVSMEVNASLLSERAYCVGKKVSGLHHQAVTSRMKEAWTQQPASHREENQARAWRDTRLRWYEGDKLLQHITIS